MQRQIRLMESKNLLPTTPLPTTTTTTTTTTPPPTSTTVESTTWFDEDFSNFEDLRRNSNFFKKLLNEYPYNEID